MCYYLPGIISESTFYNVQTYGCPIGLEAIGTETIVSFIGCHFSSDMFGLTGGSTAYNALPVRGLRSIGANARLIGGELIMTSLMNGALIEMQPLTGNSEGTRYGEVLVSGACIETASPLAIITNPNNLTINSLYNTRGRLSIIDCSGFHSQDSAAFISDNTTTQDCVIVVSNNNVNFPGNRTQQNINLTSVKSDVYFGPSPFGPGFKHPISGTSGGIIHFEDRLILNAQNLAGQNLAASGTNTTLIYKNVDNSTDGLGRFASYYNSSTGEFTIPPGGLLDIEVEAQLLTTNAVTGLIGVFQNGSLVSQGYVGAGTGYTRYVASSLPAGVILKIVVFSLSAATTGHNTTFLNAFTIRARN